MNKAVLALEDGFFLEGQALGAAGEAGGEVVFNTSMSGYQEILTDPSYAGQIVTMTYPLIGNYGVNDEDVESCRIWAQGFVVKEASALYSNWRAKTGLDEYLKKHNIVGIQAVDTRCLTRHIRLQGAMRGVISTLEPDKKRLINKARAVPSLVGLDLVKDVTCGKDYDWDIPYGSKARALKVVAMDYGIKRNILRILSGLGCSIKVVSARAKAEEILGLKPDGLFLSNGPADPAAVLYTVREIRKLFGKLPIFGICLGHQLLALALGARTYKLKFGHHGANHPVMNLETRKVEITAQNHGFCVDMDSMPDRSVKPTHINLYDKTSEGLRHTKMPLFSVQYHPEASPGPHDSSYLFNEFIDLMKKYAKKKRY
ncbi:MAG: glutamine-hydrolyzing carbamoyl-phosphate synthase small subunit [Candidatus Omnitrophica bacterium]|nr:glutamine-hydrolyzing carbamoyl-phosphate synthase small subunit [Candidatus Omnitrophota bacterium]